MRALVVEDEPKMAALVRRALARRGLPERPTVLQAGSLRLDPATRQVWRGDTPVELSAKEFALQETFLRPGQVLSRLDLLEHAWDYAYESRHGPGAGLGLAIVKVIAHAHGGTARAANRGTGAGVCVELPDDAPRDRPDR